jgi:hypothetical protein
MLVAAFIAVLISLVQGLQAYTNEMSTPTKAAKWLFMHE